MGGLSNLTPDSEESSSGGKSTHIKFWNQRNAADEIADGTQDRHKQEYYDAAQELRNMLGQNINIPIGEFMVGAVQAEKHDNPEKLRELFNTLTSESDEAEDEDAEE